MMRERQKKVIAGTRTSTTAQNSYVQSAERGRGSNRFDILRRLKLKLAVETPTRRTKILKLLTEMEAEPDTATRQSGV